MFIVVVIRKRNKVVQPRTVVNTQGKTFGDVVSDLGFANETIEAIRCGKADSPNFAPVEIASPTLDIDEICTQLNFSLIEFYLRDELCQSTTGAPSSSTSSAPNTFTAMMAASARLIYPNKISQSAGKTTLTAPEKLYDDLIDWAQTGSPQGGWSVAQAESSGKNFFKCLRDALWLIDHAHKRLADVGCKIPKHFEWCHDYNKFKENRHKEPRIEATKLQSIIERLSTALSLGSLCTKNNKSLHDKSVELVDCLHKFYKILTKDSEKHRTVYRTETYVPRDPSIDSTVQFLPSKTVLPDAYVSLQSRLAEVGDYTHLNLSEFTSEMDTYERRAYIAKLTLTSNAYLWRMAYGNNLGTISYIWTVSVVDPDMETKNAKIMNSLISTLPKHTSRHMQKHVIDKYYGLIKLHKSVIRNMMVELGSQQLDANAKQKERDSRIANMLIGLDDPDILVDFRAFNSRPEQDFKVFYDEVGKYLAEQTLAVQERRHGEVMYMPIALSVEELHRTVSNRLPPNTPKPCVETLRLQFCPSNPLHKTSSKYTRRFDIRFAVQSRQLRVHHPDGRYVGKYFKYLKEYAVRFHGVTQIVCLDDKAIVPCGEPDYPITTGVRGHNRVLVPNDSATLVALDHDFHIGGIVPSVVFIPTIPDNPLDSFYDGKIYVTSKDKVFQASNPFRHSSELSRILRSVSVEVPKPVLLMFTDGGPDHRVTYDSVKLALLSIFINLDLDVLIALRTAPNNSWVNPAERAMSILNLALQHVALARSKMSEAAEKKMKGKSNLGDLRSLGPDFALEWSNSMGPVISLLNERFSRMQFKGENLVTYDGLGDGQIDSDLTTLREMLNDANISQHWNSSDAKKCKTFQDFITEHGRATHYTFQLMKCTEEDCGYCTRHPPRSENFSTLSWLPDPEPMDDEPTQYKPFSQVFGTPTRDVFRPSATIAGIDVDSQQEDRDLSHILIAGKVRTTIACGECQKPRCIYAAKKPNVHELDEHLDNLRGWYVCGSKLPGSLLVGRRSLLCSSPIEIPYYSCSLQFQDVCFHCGNTNGLLDENNDYITEMRKDYTVVRPICAACKGSGKAASTWGLKQTQAKKRARRT